MSIYTDAQTDAAALAKLVNEDTDVTTRYGANPKKSGPKAIREFEEKGNLALKNSNFTDAGFDFATGGTIETYNQLVKDSSSNSWQWQGSLPHVVTAGTVPANPDWQQRTFNEIANISGLRDELDDRANYLTLAEAQTGELRVGQYVRLVDRDNTLWIATGETSNGVNILDAGNLRLKLIIEKSYLSSSALGVSGGDITSVLNLVKDLKEGLTFVLDANHEYSLTDTITLSKPISIISKNGFAKIRRSGNVDTHRSCFHVECSNTFFDMLYLYADDGFSERAGITYGSGAGEGNSIGYVLGSYWRLGTVFPKDTGTEFSLDAQRIGAIYDGRALSTSTPMTPYGRINIETTEGTYCGFVDVSGGSINIDSISVRNALTQAIKKGSEGQGGKISVGDIHAYDGYVETRLEFNNADESLESVQEGATVTGSVSGATGVVLGKSRYRIDLVDVIGSFSNGESVIINSQQYTPSAFTDMSTTGLDDGVVGNGGVDFDSFTIGSLNVRNYSGDLLWLLNNGMASIGQIIAEDIKNTRHIIRYSPFTNGDDPLRESKLSIGSCLVDGLVMQNLPTYYPLFFEGQTRVVFGELSLNNITAANGSNFINSSAAVSISNLKIETSGGNWSRFFNFSSGGVSTLSNVDIVFDSANRLGTCNNGRLYVCNGTYTTTAVFDGTGVAQLTAVDAV